MLKRFARLHMLTLLAGLLLTSACSAQSSSAAPYTEGNQYVTLPGPHQRYSDTGKVEMVEVFSYGCIHCAHFAPIAERLRKELPAGVDFKLMPAPFSEAWLPYARAFYAAKRLGVVDRTHLQLFTAKFDEHYPLASMDELADFYARQGVNRADFMRIATSEQTTAKMKSDLALIQKWQVDGTPTLVIDGKYRVLSEHVHTQEEMAAVAL
ncbi:MAG: thiol:disulfide interchange protein DsbA/DsbL, partial [Rhodanobacter sp.]|nr:thiol:disulfide interchange protein DsbA/DsbL [Rhodanobacter sp.]